MSDPVLAALDVTRSYRRGPETVHAVAGASLGLVAGRLLVLQGPSGSGKTTLLNLLAGWERPDGGRLHWRGRPVDPAILSWNDLAMVTQRPALLPELSARENATLPLRLAGGGGSPVEELLDRLGLYAELAEAMPDELSAGQQQRVALARAVAGGPAVVLADEPTSAQDEESARSILAVLRQTADAGAACLVAGHDPILPEYADEVAHMRDGRLEGTPR